MGKNDSVFKALVAGILAGGAAVYFSEKKNREYVRQRLRVWKENIDTKKKEGTELVADKLEETGKKVRKPTKPNSN